MTGAEFKAALETLWGDGWRRRAPEAFDVTESTLRRWIAGTVEVTGPAGRLAERLLELERGRKERRAWERAYKRRRKTKLKEQDHG